MPTAPTTPGLPTFPHHHYGVHVSEIGEDADFAITLFTDDRTLITSATGSGKHSAADLMHFEVDAVVGSAMSGILTKLQTRFNPRTALADLHRRIQRNQGGKTSNAPLPDGRGLPGSWGVGLV